MKLKGSACSECKYLSDRYGKGGMIVGFWCPVRNGKLKRFPKECDFKINRINTKGGVVLWELDGNISKP